MNQPMFSTPFSSLCHPCFSSSLESALKALMTAEIITGCSSICKSEVSALLAGHKQFTSKPSTENFTTVSLILLFFLAGPSGASSAGLCPPSAFFSWSFRRSLSFWILGHPLKSHVLPLHLVIEELHHAVVGGHELQVLGATTVLR